MVRDGCWAGWSSHFPPLFVLHPTLFSERLLSWKVTRTQTHTRAAFLFHIWPLFLSLIRQVSKDSLSVGGGEGREKKRKLSNICLLFPGCGACDFLKICSPFSVCRGWQQQCNSLSLACNRLIYLWHTILSDLHCVRCVTLTQTFTVTSRIILAAIPGEVLTWGSVCKQGCCICLISPVLKWRDSKNLTWLDFTCWHLRGQYLWLPVARSASVAPSRWKRRWFNLIPG